MNNIYYTDGNTDLHFAAATGDLNLVYEKLSAGLNINIANNNGETAVHTAAKYGKLNVLQYLIRCGANFKTNCDGVIALHIATEKDHIECAQHLLEMGTDVNIKDGNGRTPAEIAIMNDQFEMLKVLINFKATGINIVSIYYAATAAGELDFVNGLVMDGIDINVVDGNGDTAAHKAARHGNLNVLKYLIETGANIHRSFNNDGYNVLHTATASNNMECVKYLVGIGMKVYSKTREGKTLVRLAVQYGSRKMLLLLHDLGAELFVKEDGNEMFLMYAAAYRSLNCFRYLHKTIGMDINMRNGDGYGALFCASRFGRIDILKYFKELGVNFKQSKLLNGQTLLHMAMEDQTTKSAKYLIENGLDVNAMDENGLTPIFLAIKERSLKMVKFLE